MGVLLEPVFTAITAPVCLLLLYVWVAGLTAAFKGFHPVEFFVLMIALSFSQLNYGKLFVELGHLANNGRRLKALSRSNYFLRLHHFLALVPMLLAVMFLSISAHVDQGPQHPNDNLQVDFLSELYIFSLILLYWAYCFTNRATLRFLSDTIVNDNEKTADKNYASRLMTQIGNNVLFLKSENRPALYSYVLLFVVSGMMILGGAIPREVELFLGGAATVHVAISAFRFSTVVRDTTQKEETERDAIELLIAHMSPVLNRLPVLQVTLQFLGRHLKRRFFLGLLAIFVLGVLLAVAGVCTQIWVWPSMYALSAGR